jgi:hypothetical protein
MGKGSAHQPHPTKPATPVIITKLYIYSFLNYSLTRVCLVWLLEALQLWLLRFFGEALPTAFSENGFTREAPKGRKPFFVLRR